MADVSPLAVDPPVVDRLVMIEIWENEGEAARALEVPVGARLPAPLRAVDALGGALLWWEQGQWLWRTAGGHAHAGAPSLEAALDGAGVLADISGGFRRIRVRGPLWRELLMIESWFDAGDLQAGTVAGTLLHHTPVRIHAVSDGEADIYAPASLADWLFGLLREDAERLLVDVD